jgi:hypothetical protein
MAKIIFEKTDSSKYASQGGGPSGKPGFDIWIQYPDDDMLTFLGFCTNEEAAERMAYYLEPDEGEDDVVFAMESMNKVQPEVSKQESIPPCFGCKQRPCVCVTVVLPREQES